MATEKKEYFNANIPETPLMKIIRERRSVRNFDSKRPVEDEKLDAILEAARLAPSSNNTQPWHFVIVKDEKTREKLSVAAPVGAATNKWIRHAPVIIACLGKKDTMYHSIPGQILDIDFFRVDIAIAVEHMVLQATEKGLGTCWVGWIDERKIRRILKVPSSYKVLALLPIGYPKGAWPPAKERNDMKKMISREQFGK